MEPANTHDNAASSSKNTRRTITDFERRDLRKRKRDYGEKQEELRVWFNSTYHANITQSTVSAILSKKYGYLNSLEAAAAKARELTSARHSHAKHPALDQCLFEWQQKIQKIKGSVITGDILTEQARIFWQALPQYNDVPMPQFSNGWLNRWKGRFHVKEYVYHGEGAAADTESEDNIRQMEENRALAATYAPEDILNMDETGLFWKLTPDRTLATEAGRGGKKSKDRITIALTVNSTGTEYFKPFVIALSKNPRCFKDVNRRLLGVQYYNNRSKWMTGWICEQYLYWLNNICAARRRRVLLFMDNFSGHELAVQLIGGLDALSHVKVRWLPPNTTSQWQPLDQGIINTFKLHYRKQWIYYMLQQFEKNLDPNKTVTLLHAINWLTYAWKHVKPATIQHCFYKSTLLKKLDEECYNEDNPAWQVEAICNEELTTSLQGTIAQTPQFTNPMAIENFLNPANEAIDDVNSSELVEALVDIYAEYINEVDEEDNNEEQVPIVKWLEVSSALETLALYEQQQMEGSLDVLKKLESIESTWQGRRQQKATQKTLQELGFRPAVP